MNRIKNSKQEQLLRREQARLPQRAHHRNPLERLDSAARVVGAQPARSESIQGRAAGLCGLFRDGFDAAPRSGDLLNAMRRMPDWIGPAQPPAAVAGITAAGIAAGVRPIDTSSSDGALSGAVAGITAAGSAAGVRPIDTPSTDDIIGYGSKS